MPKQDIFSQRQEQKNVNGKVRNEISTDINIKPFANIRKLKYKSRTRWLSKERSREKKELVSKVNGLIDEFNKLNNDLTQYSRPRDVDELSVESKIFEEENLLLHHNYLLKCAHEARFNSFRLLQRLSYNRTKEFEKFLKGLQGLTPEEINARIEDFKQNRFKQYEKDAETSIEDNFRYVLSKAKSNLKIKQESRRKQLLAKFSEWQRKLSNPINDKQKDFASVVNSLVLIFSKRGKNLIQGEVKVLKDCFGGNRNFKVWDKKMDKKYNPFPNLDEMTNRVVIGLYAMITDRSGIDVDPLINKYLGPLPH